MNKPLPMIWLLVIATLSTPLSAEDSSQSGYGPRLISFDGAQQLAQAASRTGMLTQVLEFTLTVGPDGVPTKCELSKKFRRKFTTNALCKPLLKHHRFIPAINKNGQPTVGKYRNIIDFRMLFNQDGTSNIRNLD